MTIKNELLTVSEVSAQLKISKNTVYKLISEEKIIASKIGRQWRVRREDLEQFVSVSTFASIGFKDSEDPLGDLVKMQGGKRNV